MISCAQPFFCLKFSTGLIGVKKPDKKINCRLCRHYYVTWEPNHPYGCRAMGFKGKLLPSMMVVRTTGKPCSMFLKKKNRPDNA